jgi:hypothetical protein
VTCRNVFEFYQDIFQHADSILTFSGSGTSGTDGIGDGSGIIGIGIGCSWSSLIIGIWSSWALTWRGCECSSNFGDAGTVRRFCFC